MRSTAEITAPSMPRSARNAAVAGFFPPPQSHIMLAGFSPRSIFTLFTVSCDRIR